MIFKNELFGPIRVVMKDENPWFIARDVALSLGYRNPAEAIRDHCKKSVKSTVIANRGDGQIPTSILLIPESDVYRLIMISRLPEAERFQDWVCEDVLPSIRMTGSYANPAEAARACADRYEQRMLAMAACE